MLLRVRMLYYIKHEVLGDLVTQIQEGANARYLGPSRAVNFKFQNYVFFLLIVTSISISSFLHFRKRCIFTSFSHVLIVFDSVFASNCFNQTDCWFETLEICIIALFVKKKSTLIYYSCEI